VAQWIYRHSLNVRLCHWINVVAAGFLIVSGLAILLDYPELYWGNQGYKGHEPALRLADFGITMEGSRQWGRNTHFLFSWIFAINGLVYLAWNIARGGPWRAQYKRVQKIVYVLVIFGLAPLIVLTGLAQAPGFTAAVPELLVVFGGKQSARSIHFACTVLLCLFVLVHIVQVFRAGVVNEIRSMITGKYAVTEERR
jgi:thiosulfate reductase cytochrome b subunit